MKIIADLQIHSRYARATSKDITIENLEKYALIKGIDLLGTGDFQHPEWRKEIDKFLIEDENGVLWTKNKFPFLWQTEISLIFSQSGKKRAVHLLIFAPNRKLADNIINYLSSKGRLDYDGRPIFGMSCKQLVKELKEISDDIEIIPAHAFTPWFGLYGSGSGFDSIEECFGEQSKHIYAIESGMSADPSMIWRLQEFISGKINIVSFSDMHSFWPWRIGREATIFDVEEISYKNIMRAIRSGNGLSKTIETPPEYGKYHYDGHRNCGFSCSPKETEKLKGICPVCKKQLTIGVDFRIEQIAKKPKGFRTERSKEFYSLIPLHEIIAFVYETPLVGKKTWAIYNEMIAAFGNEFNILINVSRADFVKQKLNDKLIELILLAREGKLKVKPGFDGVYGKIIMPEKQRTLF